MLNIDNETLGKIFWLIHVVCMFSIIEFYFFKCLFFIIERVVTNLLGNKNGSKCN